MSMRVTLKQKSLLVIVSVLVSLIVVEIVLRATGRVWVYSRIMGMKGRPYIAAYSPYLPFTLPKQVRFRHRSVEYAVVYEFNHLGYRGFFPRSIRKPPHKKRILFLGDSFTLGAGTELDKTFVQRVQASFDPDTCEVVNAAYHAGYSPDSYYAYLVREGIELAPDLVIVVLYTGNDIEDMRDNMWLETDQGGGPTKIMTTRLYMDYRGTLIHPPEALEPFLPWNYRIAALRNSHLFIAVTELINRAAGVAGFSDRLKREKVSTDEAWRRFEISIESIHRWCAANDADLVFVLIPPDPGRENNEPVHVRMTEIIRDRSGRPVIDLRPSLSSEAYLARDAHFNERGNAITARIIIEYLEKNRLVR